MADQPMLPSAIDTAISMPRPDCTPPLACIITVISAISRKTAELAELVGIADTAQVHDQCQVATTMYR